MTLFFDDDHTVSVYSYACMIDHACMQFLHPVETNSYRQAAAAIRQIGRECILERIATIKKGRSCPIDLLTYILEFASKSMVVMNHQSSYYQNCHCPL